MGTSRTLESTYLSWFNLSCQLEPRSSLLTHTLPPHPHSCPPQEGQGEEGKKEGEGQEKIFIKE